MNRSNQPSIGTSVFGYGIFILIILGTMYLSAMTFLPFIDVPSIMIVLGGTLGVVVMSGGVFQPSATPKAKLLAWQNVTLAFAITSLAGMGIGLIIMLNTMDEPSQIGPAMAIAILCPLTALLGIVLFSLPMEDRYNKKIKSYREFSISRIVWFGFPLLTTFFVYLALFILLVSISTVTKKDFIEAGGSLRPADNPAPYIVMPKDK